MMSALSPRCNSSNLDCRYFADASSIVLDEELVQSSYQGRNPGTTCVEPRNVWLEDVFGDAVFCLVSKSR